MWLGLAAAVVVFVCRTHALSEQDKLSAVTSFVSVNKISSVVAFVCQEAGRCAGMSAGRSAGMSAVCCVCY